MPSGVNTSGHIYDSTFTTDGVLYSEASGVITSTAAGTDGQPLKSGGAGVAPAYGTLGIAGGGTNATSMGTTNGIVKYDATSLVTSSTATIDSTGRLTNTAQPAFLARLNANVTNATGDGTVYTLICDTEVFDVGANYNNASGVFTAPVTGKYFFSGGVYFSAIGTSFGFAIKIVATSVTLINNFNYFNGAVANQNGLVISGIVAMTANDTCTLAAVGSFGTKNNTISNTAAGGAGNATFFSGYLVA